MRQMRLDKNKKTVYSSTFDEKTGTLVRIVDIPKNKYDYGDRLDKAFEEKYKHRYWSGVGFSPVPETVDISITDKCGFGCTFCYQDSVPEGEHAPKELVEKVISGFDQPPYQVALGGGETTLHPDLPEILRRTRELGTVPNYTTNGEKLRKSVVEATNEVCGGVAMTYHSFKGLDWFIEHYKKLRDALKVQVNVHLIADKNVAINLQALADKQSELGKLRMVLLAYYPDVGRAKMDLLLTKKVYQRELPKAIKAAQDANMDLAFSEGLLPYFFSRPDLGVNTQFAMRAEGLYSCYVDPKGHMTNSSFNPWSPITHSGVLPKFIAENDQTVWNTPSQKLWDSMGSGRGAGGSSCYSCKFERRCATPHDFHYLACDFAANNKGPDGQVR